MNTDLNTTIKLFSCPKHPGGLRLTEKSCANSWKRAKQSRDCVQICKGCEIGAKHAGEPMQRAVASTVYCISCGRGFGCRKIQGMYCVSCINRIYEVVKNRNAKGHPPRKRHLYLFNLQVNDSSFRMVVSNSQLVEFILRLILLNKDMNISWPSLETHAITRIKPGFNKIDPPRQAIKKLEQL